MGLFKSLGKIIKKIGGIAKFAAPFIPGIGPLAAAGIGAGGALLSKGKKSNLGSILGGAAAGGLGKLAMGKIGGIGGASGTAGIAGKVTNAVKGGMPGVAPQGGGIGGLLGSLGLNNPNGGLNIGKIAGLGLAGAGILQGSQQQGQANEINQQVLGQLQGQQANRGQLQDLVMKRLLAQQGGGSNPFASQYGRVG